MAAEPTIPAPLAMKISYGYDCRAYGLLIDEPAKLTFLDFASRIGTAVGEDKLDRLEISYRDWDGDVVYIESDNELKWLIQHTAGRGTARLTINRTVDVSAMVNTAKETVANHFDLVLLVLLAICCGFIFVTNPVFACIAAFCVRRYNPFGCNDILCTAWQRATGSRTDTPAAPQAPASPVAAAGAGREHVEVAAAAFDAAKAHVEGCIDHAALAEVAGKAMAKEFLRQRDAAAQKAAHDAAPVSPPAPAAPAPYVEDLRAYLELLNRMKRLGYTNDAQNARFLAANGNDVLRAITAIDREADLCGKQ